MQKWVTNRPTLHGAEQEEIDKVFDFLKGEDCEVDFNKIVPMPLELRDTEIGNEAECAWAYYLAKEFGNYTEIDKMLMYTWVKGEEITTRKDLLDFLLEEQDGIYEMGKELYRLDTLYGFHDWYDWSMEHWRTTVNACDARREGNIIEFETIWLGVPYLMRIVSEKFPNVTLDYEFADEYFGYHVGRYTFMAGIVMAEYEPADNTVEARQLAKSILGWEPPEDFSDDVA